MPHAESDGGIKAALSALLAQRGLSRQSLRVGEPNLETQFWIDRSRRQIERGTRHILDWCARPEKSGERGARCQLFGLGSFAFRPGLRQR